MLENDARGRARVSSVMHLGDRSRVGNDLSAVVRWHVRSGLWARLNLYILETTSWTFPWSGDFSQATVFQYLGEATTTARFYMEHYLSRFDLGYILCDFWTPSHPQADLWCCQLLEPNGPIGLLQFSLSWLSNDGRSVSDQLILPWFEMVTV